MDLAHFMRHALCPVQVFLLEFVLLITRSEVFGVEKAVQNSEPP